MSEAQKYIEEILNLEQQNEAKIKELIASHKQQITNYETQLAQQLEQKLLELQSQQKSYLEQEIKNYEIMLNEEFNNKLNEIATKLKLTQTQKEQAIKFIIYKILNYGNK